MLLRRSIRLTGKWKGYIFIVFILAFFLFAGSSPLAKDTRPTVLRSRAYRLRLARNEDVKQQLQSLGIGTRIDLLPHNALILTADNVYELIQASSLINLVDSRQTYVVKVLADFSDADSLPTAQQIADIVGLSGVGTFAEPPVGKEPDRIIVDVHDSKIIAVVPAELLNRVAAAVSELMTPGKADTTQAGDDRPPAPAVPDETAEPEAKPEAKTESAPVEAALEAETSPVGVEKTQTSDVVDVKPEATPEATRDVVPAANHEPEDFFQAEMFKSLAEAETNAKAAEDEIAEAERRANEALAKAIKAEQFAREKERLAAEAARLAAETEKKATEAKKTVAPDQPVKAKTPTPPVAVTQEPKPQAKAEITGRTPPKAVTEVQDKARPKVDANAKPKTQPKADVSSKTPPKTAAATENKVPPKVAPKASTKDEPAVGAAADKDKMLEMLKKLAAKGAAGTTQADEDKAKTVVAEKVVPLVPPAPKPTTVRTPPGATPTDKIATEAPPKIKTTLPDADKDVQTTLTLPEKVQISALIELVGKQLKLNYMYDTKLVTGEVFLKIHDGRIKVKDMYALLESVLKFKGFIMTRRGNLVIVMQAKDAANMDPVIRKGSDDIQPGDIIVTTLFKLEHISTATAQAMLQNMKLGLLYNPIEETKTLVVTGYAYRMARMEEVLKMVDVPGKERKFRSRKLEYLLPSELAEKVKSLAEQLGTISITVSKQPVKTSTRPTTTRPTTRTPTRTPVRTPTTAASKAAADKGVYLDTDDRTNRVLMIGLEDDLETVDMLIDSLDVARYGLKSVKEYAMQYVEATEILNALGELGVITSMPGSARTSRTGFPTTSRTTTTRPTTTRSPTTSRSTTGYGAARPVEGEPQISVRLATNSLLVNATPEQHAEIEMVIRFVDVEQKDIRTVQEYEIQYVDITEVVETLAELGIVEPRASAASPRRTGGYTPPSRTPAGTRTPTTGAAAAAATTTTFEATTGAEITSQQPQIAVLESTNSLLVYATPKQHDTIALIVAHVDRELTEIITPYVIYALENQDPEELAATLNEIIQATVKEVAKSPTSKVQTATTTAGIPPKREKNEIQIVADLKSYSLIVYADKKNQQWISALIEELDAYRPQVHLDVTLVEISQDDQFNYDLDLVTKLPNMAGGGVMESAGLVAALVDPFPSGNIFEASVKDGSGIAFFSDRHIQTLLELLDKKNYGRVLARPSLLVKDNQLGEIKAEKTIYVAQEKTSIVPTTANQSQTVTDVTFEAYTSGVTLSITPHIASDKILQLEIILDRTDFLPDTGTTVVRGETFPKPLDTVASNLSTWAVLPDGATIILGGIESITQSKAIRKVPFLGDLPILGVLFRGVDETDVQSKLYVFVKATIIRPGDELTGVSDIEVISRKKREAFEADEVKFQKLEGVIPGVTPPPLDPVKILEDDEYIRELKNRLQKDEKVSVEVKLDDAY